MGSKARDTKKRVDRLLRAVGRACDHEVAPRSGMDTGVTLASVMGEGKVYKSYCYHGEREEYLVKHDLSLLLEENYVGLSRCAGPPDSFGQRTESPLDEWKVWLKRKALGRLDEIEKPYWRRIHDKSPGTFWLILVSLLSLVVAVVALIRTF